MRDPFVVSSITWHEVADEVAIDNINLLEDALRSHLKLIYQEYSTSTFSRNQNSLIQQLMRCANVAKV
jgi:hypothetical protein